MRITKYLILELPSGTHLIDHGSIDSMSRNALNSHTIPLQPPGGLPFIAAIRLEFDRTV